MVLGVLLLGSICYMWLLHRPLPQGKEGPAAEALAQKMLNALKYENYRHTRYLEWSYQGGRNHYKWDRALGLCTVKWKDYEVVLHLSHMAQSTVTQNGVALDSAKAQNAIQKALAYFNNDSFWLVAPYKVFDQGTTRSTVILKDGSTGLLVTYTTGGTTPGDSYLWMLDSNGFPKSYEMWVKIIPVGGLQASWDDWQTTESGAFLPKSHRLGPLTLGMGDVKGYR